MKDEILKKNIKEFAPNILFYGICALGIAFVRNYLGLDILSWILAVILFGLAALSLFRCVILIITTVALLRSEAVSWSDLGILSISMLEVVAIIFYCLYLLNAFNIVSLW